MTIEDLKNGIKRLEEQLVLEKKNLIKKYCDANNPYKVGDKFTDHIGTIQIESISYRMYLSDRPCCAYFGVELKKDGTPKKSMTKRHAYQSNDITSS